jgi:hypothetical protein
VHDELARRQPMKQRVHRRAENARLVG